MDQLMRGRAIARLARSFDLDIKTWKKDLASEFVLQGLPYAVFNKAGIPDFAAVCKIFEMNRLIGYRYKNVDFGDNSARGVVGSQLWEVSPHFYTSAALATPYHCRVFSSEVGKSSMNFHIEVRDPVTNAVLVRNIRQVVFMDPQTFKASSVPRLIKEHVDSGNLTPGKSLRVHLPTAPPTDAPVFHYPVTAEPDDIDFLQHVNQSAYFRFCLNATYFAWKKNYLPHVHCDPAEMQVQRAEIKYMKESFAGDQMNVICWEEEKRENGVVMCYIINKDDSGVARVRLFLHCANQSKL